jgi:hypothetical protein
MIETRLIEVKLDEEKAEGAATVKELRDIQAPHLNSVIANIFIVNPI